MKNAFWAALTAAVAVAWSAPAAATVMVATFGGATNGFDDTSGVFGYFHESGLGTTSIGWQAVFVYDTAAGHTLTPASETSTGILSATFSLNGYTVPIGGAGYITHNFYLPFGAFQAGMSDGSTTLSLNMNRPAGMTVPALDAPIPYFSLYSGGSTFIHGAGFSGSMYTEFQEVHALPVPEPASWALMILGFGALGATLRHQRRRISGPVAA